jgi:hypothetical protein
MCGRPHHQELDTVRPERIQDAHEGFFKLRSKPQHLQLYEQTKLQVIGGQEKWVYHGTTAK